MYYDERPPRRPRRRSAPPPRQERWERESWWEERRPPRRSRRRHGCLFHLFSLGLKLLFVLALAIALLYGYPVGLFRNGSAVSAAGDLPGG